MLNTVSNKIRAIRAATSKVISRFMDEHSMSGRQMWAWLKHRHEEFRRPGDPVLDENDEVIEGTENDSFLDPVMYDRMWGGIPFIYSFGDSHQLPPVGMKPFFSKDPGKHGSSCSAGKMAYNEFRDPDHNETNNTVFLMDDVIRQNRETQAPLLNAFDNMRGGTVSRDDAQLVFSRQLDGLPTEEQKNFKSNEKCICLVPTWKKVHEINYKYIQDELVTPIAKVTATYSGGKRNGANCCKKQTPLPARNALCVGAVVMLRINFLVELGLMNGAFGIIRYILYRSEQGPKQSDGTEYIICEFPLSTLPVALISGLPKTFIPIPMSEVRCDDKCCSMKTFALNICKAITIHKSQGMTIGLHQFFEYLLLFLPQNGNTPGMELVALSRATELERIAILNDDTELDFAAIMNIGKSKAYHERRKYLHDIAESAKQDRQRLAQELVDLDPNTREPTVHGGCMFLLDWYRTYTQSNKLTVKKDIKPPTEQQPLAVHVNTIVDKYNIQEDSIPPSGIPEQHESCKVVRVLTFDLLGLTDS